MARDLALDESNLTGRAPANGGDPSGARDIACFNTLVVVAPGSIHQLGLSSSRPVLVGNPRTGGPGALNPDALEIGMDTSKRLVGLVAVGATGFADCATKPLDCNGGNTKQGGRSVTYTIKKLTTGWSLNDTNSNTFDGTTSSTPGRPRTGRAARTARLRRLRVRPDAVGDRLPRWQDHDRRLQAAVRRLEGPVRPAVPGAHRQAARQTAELKWYGKTKPKPDKVVFRVITDQSR